MRQLSLDTERIPNGKKEGHERAETEEETCKGFRKEEGNEHKEEGDEGVV